MNKERAAKSTILAIDDEKNNLRILQFHLEREGYKVLTAEDGVEGLKVLKNIYKNIDLILLDRMMPNMDGMAFLRSVKSNIDFCEIPVVMQTASAEKKQVLEGIQAGVHHYLVKPFEAENMLSIVNSIIRDSSIQDTLRKELSKRKRTANLVKKCEMELRTVEEAKELAIFLAGLYPDKENAVVGIAALLLNAVEHGNLGISYEDKSEFLKYGIWDGEVGHIQSLPENINKKVHVSYEDNGTDIKLTIKDEGKGFDWKKYMDLDPERATDSHGRGIALARIQSFETVEYKGPGNEVVCIVKSGSKKAN